MPDPKKIEEIVERVVGEQLGTYVTQLHQGIVARVLAELKPVLEEEPQAFTAASPSADLDAAVCALHDVTTQSDILRNLLDGCAKFCGRTALFVIRAGAANGWQARGFGDDAAIKNFQVDTGRGLAARACQSRGPSAAAATEFDHAFHRAIGSPADGNALVLPLVVKEKVAALVYCDCGTERARQIDNSALQLLVRSAGLWLEVLALRKLGGPEKVAEAEATAAASLAAAATATSIPAAMAAATVAAIETPLVPIVPPDAAPRIAPGDEEVHKKAKKFAKLLVDEIKLYNKDKVAKGREHKDLYTRLKVDIEKSRATYEKRYAGTPAAAADYFSREIVRILADNDPSLMGEAFPR